MCVRSFSTAGAAYFGGNFMRDVDIEQEIFNVSHDGLCTGQSVFWLFRS